MKMLKQLPVYKQNLEKLLFLLEEREPVSEAAQEQLDERINALQESIDIFDDLISALNDYQREYRGLGGV